MRSSGLAAALFLAGCAGSAPPLPPDTSVASAQHATLSDFQPADAALTCEQLAQERAGNEQSLAAYNGAIQAKQRSNAVAVYLGGALAPVAYLGVRGNGAEQERVRTLYARDDVLIRLQGVRHCPAGAVPETDATQ